MGELDWHEELHFQLKEWRMENPNARQVGGAHYRGAEFQHWDFVVDNSLGYFEGQVTKYVCRWRAKNGKQDLEKAAHYLEKLISVYEKGDWPLPKPRPAYKMLSLIH